MDIEKPSQAAETRQDLVQIYTYPTNLGGDRFYLTPDNALQNDLIAQLIMLEGTRDYMKYGKEDGNMVKAQDELYCCPTLLLIRTKAQTKASCWDLPITISDGF